MRRDDVHESAGARNPVHLLDGANRIREVLDHLAADDLVEAVVLERPRVSRASTMSSADPFFSSRPSMRVSISVIGVYGYDGGRGRSVY